MDVADHPSHRGHTLISLCRKSGAALLGIHTHAAELIDHKRSPITGQPFLLIQNWTAIIQLNRQRND